MEVAKREPINKMKSKVGWRSLNSNFFLWFGSIIKLRHKERQDLMQSKID